MSVRYRKEVLVLRVPDDRGDVHPAGLLGIKAPKRKQLAVVEKVGVDGLVLVVFVEIENLALRVLHDHALHDLEAALHRLGIKRVFVLNLDDLGDFFLLVFSLRHVFFFFTTVSLPLLHVRVKHHPLGHLTFKFRCLGRVSLLTLLTNREVYGLRRALLVVKGVSERNVLLFG